MATTKKGAAGVRTELEDSSQYTVIENPRAIAAIVGFAPQGELNKIVKLTSTAEQDDIFGIGFNNWKYNQGMYGARAVLGFGGHVQFVRPYGEEIDTSNPYKRDLKTDCFVVSFDRMAAMQTDPAKRNSFNIEYFAATRYKADGAAEYGVTRKINNIAETVKYGSNTEFSVFANEEFNTSSKSRSETDAVLFAIMNADPSSARRAMSTYDIIGTVNDKRDGVNNSFITTLATKPGFIVGDCVYSPADTVSKTLAKFIVSGINEKEVELVADGQETIDAINHGYRPTSKLIFAPDNVIGDTDSDYLTVRTAVTGRGAKLFSSLRIDDDGIEKLHSLVRNGEYFIAKDQGDKPVYVRVANDNFPGPISGLFTNVHKGTDPVALGDLGDCLLDGDELTLEWTFEDTVYSGKFNYANGNAYVSEADAAIFDAQARVGITGDVTVRNPVADWSTYYDCVKFIVPTKAENESKSAYATRFRDALVKAFRSAPLNYTANVIANDIDMVPGDFAAGTTKVLKVAAGSAFDYAVGNTVAIVRGAGTQEATGGNVSLDTDNILMISTVTDINGFNNTVTIKDPVSASFFSALSDAYSLQLLNLSSTNKTAYGNVTVDIGWDTVTASVSGTPRTIGFQSENIYPNGTPVKIDDTQTSIIKVEQVPGSSEYVYTVAGTADADTLTIQVQTESVAVDLYLVGNYDVTVNSTYQLVDLPVIDSDNSIVGDSAPFTFQAANGNSALLFRSEKVLRDSEIGANFVGLGLANVRYEDINFTGVTEKVYDLTDDGEAVARLYLACTYRFNGHTYTFDGTIVEYVHNGNQLFIGDTAASEFSGTGLKFVLNESGILDAFLEDEAWDLSESILGGVPSSAVTAVSFNTNDPAVKWNAIWTYDPANNRNSSTLANAYNLFLDKDKADQTFIMSTANAIANFGMPKREMLDTTVMQAILTICEARKDCFALFDGVAERDIEMALKKNSVQFPPSLGRWGAIYDARPYFRDTTITHREVELAPSVTMAALITANRSGSVFWFPPAGMDTGIVPTAWCTRVKYERSFIVPEDPTSDIARLSDAHINPFRTPEDGIFCWGDFTLQMEDTAFNQIHVAMLIAGVHKMFYKYLDKKVFKLNTAALRSTISSDLQAKLNMIRDSKPAGFYDAKVICDDSNNTPDIIDQNKLIVDLKLKPTKTSRYIHLRTQVLSTSAGNTITIGNV